MKLKPGDICSYVDYESEIHLYVVTKVTRNHISARYLNQPSYYAITNFHSESAYAYTSTILAHSTSTKLKDIQQQFPHFFI